MNGVVHVGAHRGEEVPGYLATGRNPIICFEPQSFEWTYGPEAIIVNGALSDREGWLQLRIPHHLHESAGLDTMSASGFPLIPERARNIGWTSTGWNTLKVPEFRFDDWAKANGFVSGSCSKLCIDVQGMEAKVLRGFGQYLEDFEDITVECSQPSLYDGAANARTIVEFLRLRGFRQESPILPHGDIQFSR